SDGSVFVVDGDDDREKAAQTSDEMITTSFDNHYCGLQLAGPCRLMIATDPNRAAMTAPDVMSVGITRRSAIAYGQPPGVSHRTNAGVSSFVALSPVLGPRRGLPRTAR